MHTFQNNTLIFFNFDVFYMFRTPGFIFRKNVVYTAYGMARFTCISTSSLVARKVCIERTPLPTRLLILMHVYRTIT